MEINLVPALPGSGERLFESKAWEPTAGPNVTHREFAKS
jgi:hypothetical protein